VTLLGPIVGCFLIQYLVSQIGSQQAFNANLVLGVILVAFVLLLPKGIVPTFRDGRLGAARLAFERGPSKVSAAPEAEVGAQTVGAK
jgi:branched-chain amino acid transport system permease protein